VGAAMVKAAMAAMAAMKAAKTFMLIVIWG